MKKRVALVQPGTDEQFNSNEPGNIGFIASYLLKHGFEVTLIDELAGQDVEKGIDDFQPDIVGITATTPLAPDAYRIADYCRDKGIQTVMGGVHASVLPEEALQHVDIVVKGEGERAMLELASSNDFKSGIYSADVIKDINDIPAPARHLMDMDFYLRSRERSSSGYLGFIPKTTKTSSVTTTRGCPYKCIYCHNSWSGIPFRAKTPENVIEELLFLKNEYGVEAFFFNEDDAFFHKNRLRKICDLMVKHDLNMIWGGNTRVNNISIDLLKVVQEAGCRQLSFGFETGSQRVLDILNKKTTVDKAQQAIDMCNEVGMTINGTFMVGSPTETMEDIRMTVDFIKRNKIDVLGLVIATPFPGTEMWEWSKKHNMIPDNIDWRELDLFKCAIPANELMSSKEIEKVYREVREEIYSSKNYNNVNISFDFIRDKITHPFETIKSVVKHPERIKCFANQVKLSLAKKF